MVARASWKGFLRLSLVSVPVQAFNAANTQTGEVHFNQLHAPCHNRIRYKKVCPEHGEVPNDEIVMGYEYAKGQYVIVEDEEVKGLRGEKSLAIDLDMFVDPDKVDPIYFEGRSYYLLPDGAAGAQPYAVLLEALKHEGYWAVGHAAISRKEQPLVVRASENALTVQMLNYGSQLRSVHDIVGEIALPAVKKEELRLASKLIEASFANKFDLSKYEDLQTKHVRELIESKVKGKEIVTGPSEDQPPTINLMDALRKSVAKTGGRAAAPKKAGPKPRRVSKRKSAG